MATSKYSRLPRGGVVAGVKTFKRFRRPLSGHPEAIRGRSRTSGIPMTPLAKLDLRFYRRIANLSPEDRPVLERAIRIRYEEERRKILEGDSDNDARAR